MKKNSYKIRYEDVDGNVKTVFREAESLDDAIASILNFNSLVYYMETSEVPTLNSAIKEWTMFLIPEPHLQNFLNAEFVENGYLDLSLDAIISSGYSRRNKSISIDMRDEIRKKIIDNAFCWSDQMSYSSEYWQMLYDGRFDVDPNKYK